MRQAAARGPLIDLCGALIFLLPFAVVLACCRALRGALLGILERSREASGLPFVYLLKTLIPLFAVLIGLQGVAQAIRAALVMSSRTRCSPRLPGSRGRVRRG